MAESSLIHKRVGKYVVRRGTLNDLQAIIDIDENLFDGIDYISAMYYMFLQTERDLVLVVEDQGKLVASTMRGFFHSDPTVILRLGSRICREQRGQGIYRVINEALKKIILRDRPHLTHLVAMTDESNLKPGSYECFYRANVLRCYSSVERIQKKLVEKEPTLVSSELREMTPNEVIERLHSGNTIEEFIGRYCTEYILWLIGNWRPVKMNAKNDLKKVFSTASHVLVTTESSSRPGDVSTAMINTDKLTSLSYSFAFPVSHGFSYQIVFLGDDPALAVLHEIEHCKHLTSIGKGDVIIISMIPHELDIDSVIAGVDKAIGKHDKFTDAPWIIYKTSYL